MQLSGINIGSYALGIQHDVLGKSHTIPGHGSDRCPRVGGLTPIYGLVGITVPSTETSLTPVKPQSVNWHHGIIARYSGASGPG